MRRQSLLAGSVMAAILTAGHAPLAVAGGHLALDGTSITVGDGFPDGVNPRGPRLRFGLQLSEAFDLELHAGVTTDSDPDAFGDFEASFAGAYLKAFAPVGRRSALFALAGASTISHTQSVADKVVSGEQDGFSFGAGLETELGERFDLSADWMRYATADEEVEPVDAVSVGITFYF